MTGINHAVTGAVIGKLLPWPMAIPAAIASHFILDSLPHFGEVFEKRKRLSKAIWTIDICFAVIFLIILTVSREWIVLAAAIAAMSPDFAWIYRFVIQEKFGRIAPRPENKFNAWHVRIQRYESRLGFIVDIIWLVIMSLVLQSVW